MEAWIVRGANRFDPNIGKYGGEKNKTYGNSAIDAARLGPRLLEPDRDRVIIQLWFDPEEVSSMLAFMLKRGSPPMHPLQVSCAKLRQHFEAFHEHICGNEFSVRDEYGHR